MVSNLSRGRSMRRLALPLLVGLPLLAAVLAASRYFSDSRLDQRAVLVVPRPPVLPITNFSCINVDAAERRESAVLHGPDWTLESTIKPSCLPERDLALSYDVNPLLVSRRVTQRTHIWVTQKKDMTSVRIIESSGTEKQDLIAVGLATNHRCTSRNSKNCEIEGGSLPLRID
jgi:hypothetical protein